MVKLKLYLDGRKCRMDLWGLVKLWDSFRCSVLHGNLWSCLILCWTTSPPLAGKTVTDKCLIIHQAPRLQLAASISSHDSQFLGFDTISPFNFIIINQRDKDKVVTCLAVSYLLLQKKRNLEKRHAIVISKALYIVVKK